MRSGMGKRRPWGLAECPRSLPKWLWAGLTSRPETHPAHWIQASLGAGLQTCSLLMQIQDVLRKQQRRGSLPEVLLGTQNWALNNNFSHFPNSLPAPRPPKGKPRAYKESQSPSVWTGSSRNWKAGTMEAGRGWPAAKTDSPVTKSHHQNPTTHLRSGSGGGRRAVVCSWGKCSLFFSALISIFIASLLFALPACN